MRHVRGQSRAEVRGLVRAREDAIKSTTTKVFFFFFFFFKSTHNILKDDDEMRLHEERVWGGRNTTILSRHSNSLPKKQSSELAFTKEPVNVRDFAIHCFI
uniref:Uncharacterized protein n=1 Tax=Octactis speculum TaxID=3111310 RepID=A0A7S2BYH0_9STRA